MLHVVLQPEVLMGIAAAAGAAACFDGAVPAAGAGCARGAAGARTAWLFGERWTATAGGGLLVAIGLVLVLAGGGLLGSSRPVTRLEEPGPVVDER
jgi:hypothetical protein